MAYKLIKDNLELSGNIVLPSSKSITNRLLIIQALCNEIIDIENISTSKDTEVLIKALNSNEKTINIGHAGTSMRFLTAYLSTQKQERILTGSERMKNRPIGVLVDTLKDIGANIDYIEKEGFPPLKISPADIIKNEVEIDGSISSQYITALLLIAPVLKEGLTLKIKNKLVSETYVDLTLRLMEHFGVKSIKKELEIHVSKQKYQGGDYFVEGDWSGASYWFELAAFANNAEIEIEGLSKNSLQGDSVVVDIYKKLGVTTSFGNNKIQISKTGKPVSSFEYNFNKCPDLVQTVVVTCSILGVPFKISGAETLRIKETDRIHALQVELKKFGIEITETSPGTIQWNGKKNPLTSKEILIDTYDDHRMAMAFAPVAMKHKNIVINDPEVVVKSYPSFWDDLRKVGFGIEEIEL